MGTDINFFVERRENGRWLSCDDDMFLIDDGSTSMPELHGANKFYMGRNSPLFAILTKLSNRDESGEAKPRGLPSNMSPELVEVAEALFDPDFHGGYWLTLGELQAYDWSQIEEKWQDINGPQYEEWTRLDPDRTSFPPTYYGTAVPIRRPHQASYASRLIAVLRDLWNSLAGTARNSPNYGAQAEFNNRKRMTEQEMVEAIDTLKNECPPEDLKPRLESELSSIYCRVTWEWTHAHIAENFHAHTIPKLAELGEPEDVRCVFWFW